MTLKRKENAAFSCDVALEEFSRLTEAPEVYLAFSEDNSLIDRVKDSLKRVYDFAKSGEPPSKKSNALPELIVENFDVEQIWQQIELQNEEILDRNITQISRVLTNKNFLFRDIEIPEENGRPERSDVESEKSEEEENEKEPNIFSESEEDEDLEEKNSNDVGLKRKERKSVVDDDFFKLDEMEEFLNKEEKALTEDKKKPDNDDSESEEESEASVDFFKGDDAASNDENEDDRLKNPRYKDFFVASNDAPKQKRNKFFEEQEDSENENEEGALKSSLELREERLKQKIEDLEEQVLNEKPWQLKGEITADKRPQNSLLEEIVDFDLSARPAPVITEKINVQLEDVIKQRIRDKVFDSVVRKVRPVDTPLEYRKKLVLEQEKSKQSLAQIYENEYLKQQEALDPNAAEKDEAEPPLHKEVQTLMNSLFAKLDALSNFHYTPKPVAPELKIVVNLPAVNMEEVAPVAASDAALLAPEEIKKKPKGDPIAKEEQSGTDKKRERRRKKLKQRVHAEAQKRKGEVVGGGSKYGRVGKKGAVERAVKSKNVDRLVEVNGGKQVKSSTTFFTQLQEEVQSQIKAKKADKQKNKQKFDIKKIKL